VELLDVEVGGSPDVLGVFGVGHDEAAGSGDALLPVRQHGADFVERNRLFAHPLGGAHQIPEHRVGHAVGAEDHVETVRRDGGVGEVTQILRLVLDVLLDLEQVVLVAVALNVVSEAGRLADFGERKEEAVGVHHQRTESGFAVDFGEERGPAALRIPADGGTRAGVLFPGVESVLERVEADFGGNVGEHHMDERRADRLNLPVLNQRTEQRKHLGRFLRHHFQRAAGGFEGDPVTAVANQFEERQIRVLTDPFAPRRVKLRILDVGVRHEKNAGFVRHGEMSPYSY